MSTSPSKPTAIICIGMAGSGKTTFMQRINAHLHSQSQPPYVINLDPAVRSTPFDSNIDIRDSVNYREVMETYNLGPNGGILTSLNLFATKIDQIIGLLEKRTLASAIPPDASSQSTQTTSKEGEAGSEKPQEAQPKTPQIQNILIDTPGQIEVFVWSASGSIILDSLASTFPTVLAYIIDTPRTTSTSTFMSNMLYACSILYKTKLPMILVFNKTDVHSHTFAHEWMTDFESFQAALRKEEESGSFGGVEGGGTMGGMGGSGYMGSLLNSMSLMLEEFYSHLSIVGVSAMTGAGIDDFFKAVGEKTEEFERDYRPELERRIKERDEMREEGREKELGRLMGDVAISGESGKKSNNAQSNDEDKTISPYGSDSDSADDDEDRDGEDGLTDRYQEALSKSGGESTNDDNSFARYLNTSRMGM